MAEESLKRAPHDQVGIAMLGTAWRMMGDAREEALNGYDDLIRIFDLEPPEGFSGMEEFNAALCDELGRAHPKTREFVTQSLRFGSQTPGHLFGGRHALVERVRTRIEEAITRYIAALKPDPRHPFRARRTQDFRFSGSWSSRLRDQGFHINHVHPEGWISSCYYAAYRTRSPMKRRVKAGSSSANHLRRRPWHPARHPASPRTACAVPLLHVAWHHPVPQRNGPHHHRLRRGAGLSRFVDRTGTRRAAAGFFGRDGGDPVGEEPQGIAAPGLQGDRAHHHFIVSPSWASRPASA